MSLSLFEEIKPTLKDKWLDYYEANQRMINKLMDLGYKYEDSRHKRPNSDFIIGTVSALEPKLEEYLFCFFLVCNDLNKIVEALGLNFDPELQLKRRNKKREEEATTQQTAIISTSQKE